MGAPIHIASATIRRLHRASGDEVLVARARTAAEIEGFGFAPVGCEALAHELAAWDAAARALDVPVTTLLGGRYRVHIPIVEDHAPALPCDWQALRAGLLADRFDLVRIDPWTWGGLETVQRVAAAALAFDVDLAIVAESAHPWELALSATLAATLSGFNPRIIVRARPVAASIAASREPGLGIDWSLESGFGALAW